MSDREKFFSVFNKSSYNRTQIGNDQVLINHLYECLHSLNICEVDVCDIIYDIAYFKKEDINIPLYIDLIAKSFGFVNYYGLDIITDVVKEIHDIYKENVISIGLEEYFRETEEKRIKKMFLDEANKYTLKSFKEDVATNYIAELKFAAAIALDQKEYHDFVAYVDDYDNYQETYSPLILIKTYLKLRENLKGRAKLFWDLLFGNEYIVSLYKNNIALNQVFKQNIYNEKNEENIKEEQLDLFSYPKEEINRRDVKSFQISTIYNTKSLPNFDTELDYITFYRSLSDDKESIVLPKLRVN